MDFFLNGLQIHKGDVNKINLFYAATLRQARVS